MNAVTIPSAPPAFVHAAAVCEISDPESEVDCSVCAPGERHEKFAYRCQATKRSKLGRRKERPIRCFFSTIRCCVERCQTDTMRSCRRINTHKRRNVMMNHIMRYIPIAELNSSVLPLYAAWMPEPGMKTVAYDIQKPPNMVNAVRPNIGVRAQRIEGDHRETRH